MLFKDGFILIIFISFCANSISGHQGHILLQACDGLAVQFTQTGSYNLVAPVCVCVYAALYPTVSIKKSLIIDTDLQFQLGAC